MSSQGYSLGINIFGTGGFDEIQFQNASIRVMTDELDTSSSLNGNGSFNEGFSDATGDLQTLFVEVDSIVKDSRARALLTVLQSGFRYPAVTYELTDQFFNISGTGIYVQENRLTANIPGALRVYLSFRSLQDVGFVVA